MYILNNIRIKMYILNNLELESSYPLL